MDPTCIFCKIASGALPATLVFEDDSILAFNDIHPKASTHILIIPKQHFTNLNDLTPSHAELISHLMLSVPIIAKQQGLKGYRVVINNGPEGGQEVQHLHLHILGGSSLPKF